MRQTIYKDENIEIFVERKRSAVEAMFRVPCAPRRVTSHKKKIRCSIKTGKTR